MSNTVWKLLLIAGVLVSAIFLVIPPEKQIRLGKDLRGGVSLTYVVRMPEGQGNAEQALAQVASVLKERLNPRGVLDISVQPQGRDRIEVVMPLPSEKVQALKAQFDEELRDLLADAHIRPAELDAALAAGTAAQAFGGETERGELVTQLQEAFNELQSARELLAEAQTRPVDPSVMRDLERRLALAEIQFDDARAQVLQLSLDERRVRRVLELETEPKLDPATRQPLPHSSPRDVALQAIRDELPHLADRLSQVVAAHERYSAERTGLDDVEDLMRLMRGAGVLEFYIAVRNDDAAKPVNVAELRQQLQERGPENTDSTIAAWFPIHDLKAWDVDTPEALAAVEADPAGYFARYGVVAAYKDGQYYILLYITDAKSMTHRPDEQWTLENAYITSDQLNRPAVGFRLDQAGGLLMGRMTGQHIGEPMAIVLDGKVYSAPNLRSRISNSGVIEGTFSEAELDYLRRVLAAGALEAQLSPEPIAINVLGPSLGRDNLFRGLVACVISLIAIGAFMVIYYFFAGLVAVVALLFNALLIFAVMSLIDGTFTLPGLAGLAITMGMAVDANVLIYERIREEIMRAEVDLRGAIRLGYQRALSSILDGNLTNLIVCIVLLGTATTEVKGFAMTFTIGVCTTLFTALFVTRVMYEAFTDWFGLKRMRMLPMVVPGLQRLLHPNIDWMALRKVFWPASAIACVAALSLVGARGEDMLDTEFRSGISATMETRLLDRDDPEGGRLLLTRSEVERRVHGIADQLGADDPLAAEFRRASILTIGDSQRDPETGDVLASSFQIKIGAPTGLSEEATITDAVVNAVVAEFSEELDATEPLRFAGAGASDFRTYTYPIRFDRLGENFGQPQFTESVSEFSGGVLVLLSDLSPPESAGDLAARIDRMRQQPDYADALGRRVAAFGLTPADPTDPGGAYRSAAVAIFDPDLSYHKVDFETWEARLALQEWQLISDALTRSTSLQQVSSFSGAVAETLSARAIVAVVLSMLGILAYVWVRFGSFRYSMGTILAIVHDVIIVLGALALTHYLAGTAFASFLLIDEFRINLEVVAAILTIIGYSLNDTIVVLDRIRENKGKLPLPTPRIVNDSINQAFSRTLITSGTAFISVLILYIEGGSGIRALTFPLIVGLISGTYSTNAIAVPFVVAGRGAEAGREPIEAGAARTRPAAA